MKPLYSLALFHRMCQARAQCLSLWLYQCLCTILTVGLPLISLFYHISLKCVRHDVPLWLILCSKIHNFYCTTGGYYPPPGHFPHPMGVEHYGPGPSHFAPGHTATVLSPPGAATTVTVLQGEMFQSAPVQTVCPHCQQPIITRISHDIGLMNTLFCLFCFFVG